MEQLTFDQPAADDALAVKLCECGCGKPAAIAKYTDKRSGRVKGQPARFARGHNHPRLALHVEIGQRVGQGVVIDPEIRLPGKRQGRMVAVRGARLLCDCGNEYTARLDRLLVGRCNSCGCGRGRPGCRSDLVRAGRNRVLSDYRVNARARGFAWDLADEEFDRLVLLDCFYCGQPPSAVKKLPRRIKHQEQRDWYDSGFTYNGLDRMDSSLGYALENVVPCCETCNRAKMDRPFDEFMAWIARLTEYHWFHPELMPSRLLREVTG